MTDVHFTVNQVSADQWDVTQDTPLPALDGEARVGNKWSATMPIYQMRSVNNPAVNGASATYYSNENVTTSPLDPSSYLMYRLTHIETALNATAGAGPLDITLSGAQRQIDICADMPGSGFLSRNRIVQCFPVTFADPLPAWAAPRTLDYVMCGLETNGGFRFASDDVSSLASMIQRLPGTNRGNRYNSASRTTGPMNGRMFEVSSPDSSVGLGEVYRSSDNSYWLDPFIVHPAGSSVNGETYFYSGTSQRVNAGYVTGTNGSSFPATTPFTINMFYYSLGVIDHVGVATTVVSATKVLERTSGGIFRAAYIYDGTIDVSAFVPAGTVPVSVAGVDTGAPFGDTQFIESYAYPSFTFGDPYCLWPGSVWIPGRGISITA